MTCISHFLCSRSVEIITCLESINLMMDEFFFTRRAKVWFLSYCVVLATFVAAQFYTAHRANSLVTERDSLLELEIRELPHVPPHFSSTNNNNGNNASVSTVASVVVIATNNVTSTTKSSSLRGTQIDNDDFLTGAHSNALPPQLDQTLCSCNT